MILLGSALWRVSVMLVLNHSLLSREYILKALASIISMSSPCKFLVKNNTEIFSIIYKCQSQINFTTGGLQPISLSWRLAP
jgi:hypothetical protein